MELFWIAVGAIATAAASIFLTVQYFEQKRERRKAASEAANPLPKPTAPVEVKHNLPTKENFVGREKDKGRLYEAFGTGHPLIAIEGLGGMGKTALARIVAWELVESTDSPARRQAGRRVPDFQVIVWTEDVSREGKLTLNEVLDKVAGVLDAPFATFSKLTLPAKREEAIKRLSTTPCLLIVDNFETIQEKAIVDFMRDDIPWPPSKALITSREGTVRAAYSVPLGRMEFDDAKALVQGFRLPAFEKATAEELSALYVATDGNPYAIRFAAGWVSDGQSLMEVVESFQKAEAKKLFDYIYGRSWNELLAPYENAKRTLISLPLFAATASEAAIEAVSDVPAAILPDALRRLGSLNLVDTVQQNGKPPRYELHQLTRAFARSQLTKDHEIARRMEMNFVRYFLERAEAWSETWKHPENVEYLEAERENLFEAVGLADRFVSEDAGRDYSEMIIRFSNAMYSFLWGRGYWSELMQVCERAAAAAQRLGDFRALARQWWRIGRVYVWRDDGDTARKFCQLSYDAAAKADGHDPAVLAIPRRLDGQIAMYAGQHENAEALLSLVLESAPPSADDEGQAATLIDLGNVAMGRKKFDLARERFRKALDLDHESGTLEGKAASMSFLAQALFNLGDVPGAKQYFEGGLESARKVGRLITVGDCQLGLARVHHHLSSDDEALRLAQAAVENYRRLLMRDSEEEANQLAQRILQRKSAS